MEKRLTTSAMLFSVGFIFMLVCAVGAFFYGMHIGSSMVEAKYASENEKSSTDPSLYRQQDLVSFYHTVFSPYREFQDEWLDAMNKLAQSQAIDESALFKGLSKLAGSKAKEAGSFDMQKTPLLGKAQNSYIRSLKLFKDASDKAASLGKSTKASNLKDQIEKEKIYVKAVQEAYTAQQAYFEAMEKWASSIDPNITKNYKAAKPLKLSDWGALPIAIKNRLNAEQLREQKLLLPFYPQDLSSRIDDFIKSGQADKMMLETYEQIVQILIDTEAVRAGDFIRNKNKYYHKELMPQVPYFFPIAK